MLFTCENTLNTFLSDATMVVGDVSDEASILTAAFLNKKVTKRIFLWYITVRLRNDLKCIVVYPCKRCHWWQSILISKSVIITICDLQTDVVISCLASRSGTKSDSYKIDYQVSKCYFIEIVFERRFWHLSSLLHFCILISSTKLYVFWSSLERKNFNENPPQRIVTWLK